MNIGIKGEHMKFNAIGSIRSFALATTLCAALVSAAPASSVVDSFFSFKVGNEWTFHITDGDITGSFESFRTISPLRTVAIAGKTATIVSIKDSMLHGGSDSGYTYNYYKNGSQHSEKIQLSYVDTCLISGDSLTFKRDSNWPNVALGDPSRFYRNEFLFPKTSYKQDSLIRLRYQADSLWAYFRHDQSGFMHSGYDILALQNYGIIKREYFCNPASSMTWEYYSATLISLNGRRVASDSLFKAIDSQHKTAVARPMVSQAVRSNIANVKYQAHLYDIAGRIVRNPAKQSGIVIQTDFSAAQGGQGAARSRFYNKK
jgi:hypothetical protein